MHASCINGLGGQTFKCIHVEINGQCTNRELMKILNLSTCTGMQARGTICFLLALARATELRCPGGFTYPSRLVYAVCYSQTHDIHTTRMMDKSNTNKHERKYTKKYAFCCIHIVDRQRATWMNVYISTDTQYV